jgi:hypothetical protein
MRIAGHCDPEHWEDVGMPGRLNCADGYIPTHALLTALRPSIERMFAQSSVETCPMQSLIHGATFQHMRISGGSNVDGGLVI